jgi:hypothetical protein
MEINIIGAPGSAHEFGPSPKPMQRNGEII